MPSRLSTAQRQATQRCTCTHPAGPPACPQRPGRQRGWTCRCGAAAGRRCCRPSRRHHLQQEHQDEGDQRSAARGRRGATGAWTGWQHRGARQGRGLAKARLCCLTLARQAQGVALEDELGVGDAGVELHQLGLIEAIVLGNLRRREQGGAAAGGVVSGSGACRQAGGVMYPHLKQRANMCSHSRQAEKERCRRGSGWPRWRSILRLGVSSGICMHGGRHHPLTSYRLSPFSIR